jgi:hypothetical protein
MRNFHTNLELLISEFIMKSWRSETSKHTSSSTLTQISLGFPEALTTTSRALKSCRTLCPLCLAPSLTVAYER